MIAATPPAKGSIFLSCMVKCISRSKNQVNFFTSDFKILETQVYVVLIMMILDQRGSVLERVYANNCLL
jgi:hypothetical protein